ncbi:MAG TPA: bifunctional phosphoribosylaminoimidazolecarboxamide formyltransferase/IMP cyclohydrolase [Vicinamibacterales bacterium]|jgi:phosphoribosylaminoimidazolecarboxamide formyltransferase/IMP cyclohydrolase|nr:bifunctional phosphoribosylaminoimidazolecarboxamide formyltransferase/IMP cyclohydrolase [Vicinamibacterales bacterium]
MPRALLSVSDKTGVVELGRGLAARGFELVSTGGTAKTLTAAGLPVTNVSDLTGFPEMMDGRVKTLHPALHAGILARRTRADDLEALERHGIGLVDVVVVNLYPFVKAASNPATPFDALVEEIDIGGPSLVRAAAKNFRGVLVVVDPADYPRLLAALDETPSLALRYDLMRKALAHTGAYDTAISETLATIDLSGNAFVRRQAEPALDTAAAEIRLTLEKIRDLRYGENPHQKAAWYRPSPDAAAGGGPSGGLGRAEILQGKELSYTNLLDLDAAARIVLEFTEPAAAVIKHTNPCGAATGASIAEAYVRARDADSLAAFGGIVAVNRPIDVAAAEAIVSTFIEAVIAPAVDEAARAILERKARMRVITASFDRLEHGGSDLRSILGAVLIQERDRVAEAQQLWAIGALPDGLRVATKRPPTAEEWHALRFAWRICAHVKSNTIIFTDAQRTLAIGAGQMSRVDAAKVAVMKAAAGALKGSVAASDAYFPFQDGLDAVALAGATAVVQPGGSVRDAEVVAAADEHGLAMVFTGKRHFRH